MIVYLVGTHGVGKTTFVCSMGPDAEVCFYPPNPWQGETYEQIAEIPWVTVRVRDGQPLQPLTLKDTADSFQRYDFSRRAATRAIAGISDEARVVRVSADALYDVGMKDLDVTQRAQMMHSLNERLEAHFDVVVHETFPLAPPREQDRIIALSVPYPEIARRRGTLQWNDRIDLGRSEYVEAARKSAQPSHPYCFDAKSYARLWWANGQWRPAEVVARERIAALGNWYHPQLLAGEYSTNPAVASYEGRWNSLSSHFPTDLTGVRLLDIGANSGFNAMRLAERGATVVAIEPDPRVVEQFRAVVEMGPFPVKVTNRITYHNRPAEIEDPSGLGKFETTIMSACHYYINRSTREPFRHPGSGEIKIGGLRTPLWALLDGIRQNSDRVLIPTNREHADRKKDPYPDAEPEWIKRALESVGFHDVAIHAGYAHTPIIEAFSRPRA